MKADDRRKSIVNLLVSEKQPVSGNELSENNTPPNQKKGRSEERPFRM